MTEQNTTLQSFFDQQREQLASQAMRSIELTRGIDPDEMGRALEEGPRRGVPPFTLVNLDGQRVGQVDNPIPVMEQIARQPSLARYLAVPELAAVSQDDGEALEGLAAYGRQFSGQDEASIASRAMRNTALSMQMVPPALRAFWNANEVRAQTDLLGIMTEIERRTEGRALSEAEALEMLGQLAMDQSPEMGERAEGQRGPGRQPQGLGRQAAEALRYATSSPEEREAMRGTFTAALQEDADTMAEAARAIAMYTAQRPPGEEFSVENFGRWALYNGISGVAEVVTALGVGAVTGGTGLLAYSSARAMGETMESAVQEEINLADPDFIARAWVTTFAAGAVDTLGGVVSVRNLGRLARSTPTELIERAARSRLAETGAEITRNALEEAVVEVAQEMLQEYAVDGSLSNSPDAWAQRLEAAAAGLLVGGVVGAPVAYAGVRREEDAAAALLNVQDLEALNQGVRESQTRTRSPRAFERFMDFVGFTQRGVFIDAAALAAYADQQPDVLARLNLDPQKVEQAAADGQQVAVNMATYMQQVPGRDPDLERVFVENSTLVPGRMSAQDAQTYSTQEKPERRAEARAEAQQQQEALTVRQRVAARVTDAVRANIGYAQQTAAAFGELHGAFFQTMSERFGNDAVADQYGLEVVGLATPDTRRAQLGSGGRQLTQDQAADIQDASQESQDGTTPTIDAADQADIRPGVRRTDGGTARVSGGDVAVDAEYGAATGRPVQEITGNPTLFRQLIQTAKDSLGPIGAQVTVYDSYEGMRLFILDDGKSGFALNGDDVISVFSSPDSPKGVVPRVLEVAVAEGGRRLDAFDTFLPRLYAREGFRAVAALPFNREYAPDGWDYDFFQEQLGESDPDVVFMVYDPANATDDTDNLIDDYDEGVRAQDAALAAAAPREFNQSPITRVDPDTGDTPDRISTRLPWTQRATEDPMAENLIIGLDAMRANPEAFAVNMSILADYPGFNPSSTDPDVIAEEFITFVMDNLRYIYEQVPPEIRDRSRRWYNGAQRIAQLWSADYGLPDYKIAGVLAALSPQKDWYQNVSLGERLLDIYTTFTSGNRVAFVADEQMADTAARIYGKAQYAEDLQVVLSSSLADLDDAVHKAMWIRIYDETYNARGYRVVSSEGDFIGEPQGNVAWGSNVEIAKAVRTIESTTRDEVSAEMGTKHKVRNFFNNILAPDAPHGDVTIDTHAVAAALIRPLSGNSPEVHHNFGSSPAKSKQPDGWRAMKNIGDSGSHGSYGIYAEAHRRLAEELGIYARELQSITWEAVRGLFSPAQKRNKSFVQSITDIWTSAADPATVRDQILQTAGGVDDPTWYDGPDSGTPTAERDASYAGELVDLRLQRRAARQLVDGDRGPGGAGGRTRTLYQQQSDGDGTADGGRAEGAGPRGVIRIPAEGVANGTAVIEQFKNGDESTFLHESGHFFLEVFRDLALRADAPQSIKDDYETIKLWMGKDNDDPFTVAEQEMWAEAFENYLFEGRAPSASLKVAFAKFARWLTRVYNGLIRRPDTQPSPAVKEVMDRMLATEAELDATRAELDAEALYRSIPPYTSQTEWQPYVRTAERTEAEAHGRLLAKQMRRIAKKRKADMTERRRELTAEIGEELEGQRVYQLIGALGGRAQMGRSGRLDRGMMVQLFGEQVLQDLTKGRHRTTRHLYDSEGTDPEFVAETFGYDSVGQMLVDIQSARPIEEELAARVENALDAEFGGDPLNEAEIREEAEAAIKNARAQETVAHEVERINREQTAAGSPSPRGPTAWQRENAAARTAAQREVDAMSVRDVLGYRKFLRASQQAARDAQRAMARVVRNAEGVPQEGSIAALREAEEAKRRQLKNDHMYRYARDKVQLIKRSRAKFRKLSTLKERKKLGEPFASAITTLLDRFEFREVPVREARKQAADLAELQNTLIQQDMRGAELSGAIAMIAGVKPVHYTNLQLSQLQSLIDAVTNIEHIARNTNRQIAEEEARDLSLTIDDIAENAEENMRLKPLARGRADRSTFARGVREFLLSTLNADTILRQLDGPKAALGPAYRAIKLPIDRAVARVQERQMQAADEINAIWGRNFGSQGVVNRMRKDRRVYQGLGDDPLSRLDLVAMALNVGNRTNFDRLTAKGGRASYDADAVRRVLVQELTEAEWRFVQDTWDYLESYWPEIAAQERKFTGIEPQRVESELMVEGAPDFVKGGYFPIRYDGDISIVADDKERLEAALQGMNGLNAKAQTRAGHTQARLSEFKDPPAMLLDLNIINGHVFQVIQDLELRGPIRDAGRIIYDDRFLKFFKDAGRVEDHKALRAWLEDVANGGKVEAYGMGRWFRWMRSGFTLGAIGFRLSTILIQPLGLTQSMVQVGYTDMMRGYAKYSGSIPKIHRMATQKSAIMRERIRMFDKDVNDTLVGQALDNPLSGGYERAVGNWLPWAYAGMQQMQYWVVDLPTWFASYEKGLRNGMTEDDAIAAADRDVRVAQGSGLMSDRGMLERGRLSASGTPNEVARLFTVLGSYMFGKFNLAYQRTAGTDFKNPAQFARWMMDMMMLFVIEATLVYILRNGIPDEEEEELPIPALMAREGFHTMLGTLPIGREVSAAFRGFGGGSAYSEYVDALAGVGEGVGNLAVAPFSEEVDIGLRDVQSLLGFGGTFLLIPSGKVNDMLDATFDDEFQFRDDQSLLRFVSVLAGHKPE